MRSTLKKAGNELTITFDHCQRTRASRSKVVVICIWYQSIILLALESRSSLLDKWPTQPKDFARSAWRGGSRWLPLCGRAGWEA